MFDFSFLELLIIGVITLIVVGPERLPGLMRTVGLWVGRARATVASLRSEFEREVNASGLRETERHIRKGMAETEREVQAATDIGAPREIGGGNPKSKGPAPAEGVTGEPPAAAAESEQVRPVDAAPEAPVDAGDAAAAPGSRRAEGGAPAEAAGADVAGKEQR